MESGQSATDKEALLLKCKQVYIRILVSTTALPTLLQALRTKNNFRFFYLECVAFQFFSPRRSYKDKTINFGFRISVVFEYIKRKIKMKLGSWIKEAFLHLSKATQVFF